MVSAIDPTKPETGLATTASVRANFATAKAEIEALQSGVIPSLPGVGLMLTFETVADMKAYDPLLRALMPTDALVRVGGYYTAGDGGGGTFRWADASVATANNGTIIAPDAGTGRWLRVVETPRNYDFLWFGAKRDGVTDAWAPIMATIDAAKAVGAGVEFSEGDYAVSQRVVINGSDVDPDGPPAGEKTAVHLFRGQGRQPFLSRFIAMPGGTWPAGHAVVVGRNLALKTVDSFAVQANGVADWGLDLAWIGTAVGVGGSAPSCSNTFTNFTVENAKSLGINLDQAADCKISTILYRGGTASIGISLRLGGGGIWADNIFSATGRIRLSCQNAGIVNFGAFSGFEITDDALNHIYLVAPHLYPYTPRRTLLADPFTTTNGSATVTVNWPGHGLVNGNFVEFSGCVDTNGILAANLNTTAAAPRAITYVDDNNFTVVAGGAATATGVGGGTTVSATGRGWTVWSSSPIGSGPRSFTTTGGYMNTLGVAGQKHFAGRWLNGAQINGTRIGNNLGAPTDGDVYFDTTHWTVAGTDGTPPMFVFNNCGFSVDRPVSVANKVLVGFNGMMQGTPVAANSFPLLEHPGQFHLPNADIGNPMKFGPLPTYFWTDAQGHLRMDKAAPSIDADGAIMVPQQRGNGSPLPAGLNVTPYFAGAEYYDFTNNTWYKALGTTATDWRPIADQGADMVAASTLDLSLSTGDVITVTGNTTITALGTMPAGVQKTLNFTGAPTLTHNATSLIIPGASNIALSSGNVVDVLSIGSGNWKVIGYSAAGFNATQLVAGTMPAARLPVSAITSGTISGVDLQLRTFTVATLPSAATVGRIIYVSDGTGNNRVATSNGTNWVWLNTATVVS